VETSATTTEIGPLALAGAALKIDDLLRFTVQKEASDLHLKPMRPPLVRAQGKLLPLRSDPLHPDQVSQMLLPMLSERQRKTLDEQLSVDFGYSIFGISRFRATVFYQRGTLSAVFRRVPIEFPTLDEWGHPAALSALAELPQGLVLLTGPAGSGKSSTLAALLRLIANTRLVHIVTIEDPIEFLLKDNLGSVTQREVGTDTPGFVEALRNTLRQDPDVIMVGEMRDLETIQTVLTAAETGHLVFSTLHTNSAVQTVDRIIDMFPAGNHRQIRQQLASVLQGVVSLRLLEREDGTSLVAAVEILRHSPRVAKLIADGNLEALQEEIENSVTYHRMQSMNQSLAALVLNGAITKDAAMRSSSNPADLDLLLRRFLYSIEKRNESEEGAMPDAASDFSKVLELQEIRKMYEDLQERHRGEISERDAEIAGLRSEIEQRSTQTASHSGATDTLRTENERLARQLALVRDEYESRIERLNARIKEISGTAAAATPESDRKGFFRR
jgi:twitching motility protein PilT